MLEVSRVLLLKWRTFETVLSSCLGEQILYSPFMWMTSFSGPLELIMGCLWLEWPLWTLELWIPLNEVGLDSTLRKMISKPCSDILS